MKLINFLIGSILFLSSCRIVDFTIKNENERVLKENLLFVNSGYSQSKTDIYHTPYIFFNTGTYYASIVKLYSIDTCFTQKKMESYVNKYFYNRGYPDRWGIYTLVNDSIIMTESISNVEYLTGPPTSLLPLYDTLYTEKFVFKNDTTLLRYDKPDANWRLRDTLYLNKNVDISFIDPSKAWIYKKMLPYPYWEKKKKANKK